MAVWDHCRVFYFSPQGGFMVHFCQYPSRCHFKIQLRDVQEKMLACLFSLWTHFPHDSFLQKNFLYIWGGVSWVVSTSHFDKFTPRMANGSINLPTGQPLKSLIMPCMLAGLGVMTFLMHMHYWRRRNPEFMALLISGEDSGLFWSACTDPPPQQSLPPGFALKGTKAEWKESGTPPRGA